MQVFDDTDSEGEEGADAGNGAKRIKGTKGKGGAEKLKEKIDSLQQMIAMHAEEVHALPDLEF